MRPPRAWSPQSTRLLQLAATLLIALYMLFIGGTFDATIRFRVQLLNTVAGGALALLWLGVRLAQRQGWRTSGLELPLLLFAATQWVTLLTSAQPRLGLEWAAGCLAWTAAFCILYNLLASGWPREYVTNALLVVAAVLAADGIWAAAGWYLQWARLGQLPPVNFRYFGLLGHANLTAGLLNLLLPLVIARVLSGSVLQRAAMASLAAAMLVTEFFTSSRGGWLAGGAALAALGLLLVYQRGGVAWLRGMVRRWNNRSWILKTASLLGLCLAAGGAAWLLLRQARQITHGELFDSRSQFWPVAWDLFKRQPLNGAGPDLFPWFYSHYYSIPPDFFAPHAHSGLLQILCGSGLLGLAGLIVVAAGAARLIWRAWRASNGSVETAALMAGLLSVFFHQLFDYLFGTPIMPLLVLVITALALAPLPGSRPSRARSPLWLVAAVLVPLAVFAFALRASYWNDVGLAEAAGGQWQPAATAFEQAAQNDPGLTLYWEEAAYAETRAGHIEAALSWWEQAARSDPYWAVVPASIGILRPAGDAAAAQAARSLAPGSYLFALNAGAISEAQGSASLASEAYTTALNLNPRMANALFWQQSPQRASVLDTWRAHQPADNSGLAAGWAALKANAPAQAVALFQAAMTASPDSLEPYAGLASAYLALPDVTAAQRTIDAGLALPVAKLDETLGLHLVAGDVRAARGDRAGATAEYSIVFSAISDYNIDGPGSYGDTQREWQVYHRQALPTELIPQLPRAVITPEMDQRFARLAQWQMEAGQHAAACYVLVRVNAEAPHSTSGQLYSRLCGAP